MNADLEVGGIHKHRLQVLDVSLDAARLVAIGPSDEIPVPTNPWNMPSLVTGVPTHRT